MPRLFGEIPGIAPGAIFENRAALRESGIHPPTQAGISYSEEEGADSIVLSGGYVDDEDYGDVIVYTGMSGRDVESGRQVTDQTLTRGNKALAVSCKEGLPVRVSRGAQHKSDHSPPRGYQYAGLYRVEEYWHERGQHGFLVWRFRLRKLERESGSLNEVGVPQERSPSPAPRALAAVLRIVRDTNAAKEIKKLYAYKCQVCGIAIATPAGLYAEAAHIRPLGRPHNGPDSSANLLCLCPNHHVMFDTGAFGIGPDRLLIGLSGRLTVHPAHTIETEHLDYHRTHYGLIADGSE